MIVVCECIGRGTTSFDGRATSWFVAVYRADDDGDPGDRRKVDEPMASTN